MNVLVDYVALPFAFHYLRRWSPTTGQSTDIPLGESVRLDELEPKARNRAESEAFSVTEEPPKNEGKTTLLLQLIQGRYTYIHWITHGCIAAYIAFSVAILFVVDNPTRKLQYQGLLMLLFLPIGVIYYLDRKKFIVRSWPYFYIYLFLVGSFALVPVSIVAGIYVQAEGSFPYLNIIVFPLQSLAMLMITLISKKAAKNMVTKAGYSPFVFRYQFFEEFVALILFVQRRPDELLFWLFTIYQVKTIYLMLLKFRLSGQCFVMQVT